MKRRTLLAAAPAALATPLVASPLVAAPALAAQKTKIVWWHAMTSALADEVNRIVARFNASQNAVEVEAVYKGGYADVLTATIAAVRAGQAPHLVQIFEVGTGTMLAARKAVKQAWQLSKETGVKLDPARYIPAVRGYYSLTNGNMASVPFNSSTAVMWYNKDAFRKAGLDPSKPPATWQDVRKFAQIIKAKNAAPTPMTTSWPAWIQLEQYSAIHNLPYATKANGFEGLDAKLVFNSPGQVKHVQMLVDMTKEGTFKYPGRANAGDAVIVSGEAAISFGSSASRGELAKHAKFDWGEAYLPYDPTIIKQPRNSIIGGASLWTMTAPHRTHAEYKAVATFLQFLGHPDNDAEWAAVTGYVPITFAGFDLSKKQGFYTKNPGTDIPVKQLARGTVDNNTRGLRLGRLPEIRNIVLEEWEKAFQGNQTAQQAMDNAVTRGNKVLREFQRAVKA